MSNQITTFQNEQHSIEFYERLNSSLGKYIIILAEGN